MSMPNNTLSNPAAPSQMLQPDLLGRPDRTIDHERGGIGLSDPSQGLDVQDWRARLDGNDVLLSPSPYTSETLLFSEAGITELSLSFDQNMRPVLAYMAGGQAKLYWYDTSVEAQITTNLAADVRSPFLSMDDKRAAASTIGSNDVLLFYIRSSQLCYRQQRERYQTERILQAFAGPSVRIRNAGMNEGLRMQIELVGQNA